MTADACQPCGGRGALVHVGAVVQDLPCERCRGTGRRHEAVVFAMRRAIGDADAGTQQVAARSIRVPASLGLTTATLQDVVDIASDAIVEGDAHGGLTLIARAVGRDLSAELYGMLADYLKETR